MGVVTVAKVYDKGPGEKVIICDVRESLTQRFIATDWTDLRVGFYLSATQAGADDTITALSETIGVPSGLLPDSERAFVGIGKQAVNFLGYTNRFVAAEPGGTNGQTLLVSSDAGIGTTNTNFWRLKNELSDINTLQIVEGGTRAFNGNAAWNLHLIQNTGGAGGYATLVRLRYQRDDAGGRRKIIRMSAILNASDAAYTSTPSAAALQAALQTFPAAVTQLGPVQLSEEPDALMVSWPFHNSRIRIHAAGILKVV